MSNIDYVKYFEDFPTMGKKINDTNPTNDEMNNTKWVVWPYKNDRDKLCIKYKTIGQNNGKSTTRWQNAETIHIINGTIDDSSNRYAFWECKENLVWFQIRKHRSLIHGITIRTLYKLNKENKIAKATAQRKKATAQMKAYYKRIYNF